jgi:class 3 adenylate cyclase
MADLPTGTVTFLFTDVEGSTRLWERHPDPLRAALARHGGVVVRPRGEGDSRFAVIPRATDAVAAAAAIQQGRHACVRHTGERHAGLRRDGAAEVHRDAAQSAGRGVETRQARVADVQGHPAGARRRQLHSLGEHAPSRKRPGGQGQAERSTQASR